MSSTHRLLAAGFAVLLLVGVSGAQSPRGIERDAGALRHSDAALEDLKRQRTYFETEYRRPGIGVTMEVESNGTLVVQHTFSTLPAAKSGIHVGDILLSVDGISLLGRDGVTRLRGLDLREHTMLVSRDGRIAVIPVTPVADLGSAAAKELTSHIDMICDCASCLCPMLTTCFTSCTVCDAPPGSGQRCNGCSVSDGYWCKNPNSCASNCSGA